MLCIRGPKELMKHCRGAGGAGGLRGLGGLG